MSLRHRTTSLTAAAPGDAAAGHPDDTHSLLIPEGSGGRGPLGGKPFAPAFGRRA